MFNVVTLVVILQVLVGGAGIAVVWGTPRSPLVAVFGAWCTFGGILVLGLAVWWFSGQTPDLMIPISSSMLWCLGFANLFGGGILWLVALDVTASRSRTHH